MKTLSNQHGIALITALILTLVCLTVVMAMFYLVGKGVEISASQKRYRTAREASYGGADIALKEIAPLVFQGLSSAKIQEKFPSAMSLQLSSGTTCLKEKLNKPTEEWPTSCSQTLDPKTSPDLQFTLKADSSVAAPYKVYTKIVDTIRGNSDISGIMLEGAGVAESSAVITPQHFPFIYTVEVQAEKSSHATEQANLSVQYAY